ncbi:MAG: PIN domain nuclease [Bdellovibrionota bacterium]
MKVFVDTNVWINYLGGRNTNKTKRLSELVESGQPIYSLAVIIQEVLQGFKHDRDISAHVDKLEALNFLPFEFQDAIEAAKLYRSLRKQGIASTTIDLQIAAICIRHELQLLTEDKDFSMIAEKFNFSLA